MIDGNGEWLPLPESEANGPHASISIPERLDSLLPSDSDTGVAQFAAFRTYLGAYMDLMSRHGQPLTLLMIAADPSDTLRFLGAPGAKLIGGAISRWLRQETRVHDVLGRSPTDGPYGTPRFLMLCTLMPESPSAQFAERLREAMTISAADQGTPWLTLSVGVASLSLDTDSPETLILRAEAALGSAQRAGGGRVWTHSDTIRRIADRNPLEPDQE